MNTRNALRHYQHTQISSASVNVTPIVDTEYWGRWLKHELIKKRNAEFIAIHGEKRGGGRKKAKESRSE